MPATCGRELLDLELGSIIDYGPAGTWLKGATGQARHRTHGPLSAATLAALDEWVALRGTHRPLPHPRTGVLTDFLFTRHGRRWRLHPAAQRAAHAAESAEVAPSRRRRLMVTPHQLRHTWATELANTGMSLQAAMSLLPGVTPQWRPRYATLASPTLRAAYDEAMGKDAPPVHLTPVGKPILPDKVGWLHSEMLKTRVAHGYCARHESAGACPYANICETCDNYVTAPEFRDTLTDQLADVQALRTDAECRGWTDEAARHDRVAHPPTTSSASIDEHPTPTG
ncbi:tyrosine-type recombinase/integrase [Mycobacterium kubicae]|uniref:tyrosine-type recombinase/integrase n=1 Tax=Mycobacterium kubicae TaxID=120959 RepID=UPI00163EFD5A|nr:tyrosine-type recombinase/integrase [Mycobacterium kubicae]